MRATGKVRGEGTFRTIPKIDADGPASGCLPVARNGGLQRAVNGQVRRAW